MRMNGIYTQVFKVTKPPKLSKEQTKLFRKITKLNDKILKMFAKASESEQKKMLEYSRRYNHYNL